MIRGNRFQSTHSLRSATETKGDVEKEKEFQSTHSLRSATPDGINRVSKRNVSIHALLAECDVSLYTFFMEHEVSIHALLAECDCA